MNDQPRDDEQPQQTPPDEPGQAAAPETAEANSFTPTPDREEPSGVHSSKQQLRSEPDSTAEFVANAYAAEPVQSPYQQVSEAPQPSKKSKKGLVIGIVAATLLLLGGSGAAAYNYWYQNPQKVITDAVMNMFKAETVIADGTFVVDVKDQLSSSVSKVTITVDAKSSSTGSTASAKMNIEADDQTFELSGDVLYDNTANLYFKANDVQKLFDEYLESMEFQSSEVPQSVTDLVNKVDGQWIRVSAEDISEYSEEIAEQQECLADVYSKLETDTQAQSQLADAYRNNQFIVIKEELGSRDGALGYVIGGDETKAKSFIDAVKETQIYKDIKGCDDNFEINSDDLGTDGDDQAEVRFELWITRFGHELKQLKATVKDDDADGELIMNTRFNEQFTVDAPSEYVPLSEIIADIEQIYSDMWTTEFEDADMVDDNYYFESDFEYTQELDFNLEET